MINNLELFYILNGTEISFQNQKNELFLTLETSSPLNTLSDNFSISNPVFKVSGIHPYLLNNDFDEEIRSISKFRMVLCSMPDYSNSKDRSIIKYGDQISLMLSNNPNNIFIVATNDGNLKLQKLNGDQTLTSVNIPHNAKFTILPPENKFPSNKPLFFDDIIILRSSFGGNLALTMSNNSKIEYEKGGELKIGNIDDENTGINSNSNIKIEESKWKLVKTDVPMIEQFAGQINPHIPQNSNSSQYRIPYVLRASVTRVMMHRPYAP